jgi:hypothetical protein
VTIIVPSGRRAQEISVSHDVPRFIEVDLLLPLSSPGSSPLIEALAVRLLSPPGLSPSWTSGRRGAFRLIGVNQTPCPWSGRERRRRMQGDLEDAAALMTEQIKSSLRYGVADAVSTP